MARGGARAGAGKKPGQRDRATLETELALAKAQLADLTERREAERSASGRKQAIDVLDDVMHAAYGLMAQHQPLAHGEVLDPASGRKPDNTLFQYYMGETKDAAFKLANFQSPRFKSVVIGVDPSLAAAGGAAPSSAVAPGAPGTLEQLSPAQSYRMLRDHDLIDLTASPAKPAAAAPAAPAKKRA